MAAEGPLAGLRVVDMSRLAPGPYCTMLLADLGAEVIAVGGGRTSSSLLEFSRGKTFVSLDLKAAAGRDALHRLVATADVFVEGFRPGVAGRLGADYETLAAINPRLVYCSLTGYGQDGPRAQEAGHDLNYLSISGVLGTLGEPDRPPVPPPNIMADFAGGSLFAAVGILAAIAERERSGRGQAVDVAMVRGCRSLMGMFDTLWATSAMPARGQGIFNSPMYRCYRCACGGHVAVGALEDAFFATLWTRLFGATAVPDHMDVALWPDIAAQLAAVFETRTRDAWAEIFRGSNACVTPVLTPAEAAADGGAAPVTPLFSRTPGAAGAVDRSDRSAQVFAALGLGSDEIAEACGKIAVGADALGWPPELKNIDAMERHASAS